MYWEDFARQRIVILRSVIYIFVAAFLITSCSSVKRSESNLSKGNYEAAIRLSIKKIKKGRNAKANREHILILEEAFAKAKERDESNVTSLKQANNPENTEAIYDLYVRLENRQAQIRPLLPLKGASFNLEDYTSEIEQAKQAFSEYLFAKGDQFLKKGGILNARRSHSYFTRLKQINRGWQSIDSLLEEAHYLGTDFVHVVIENRTEQVIPKRLETAILDFDTYKLDDFWTEYHGQRQSDVDYTFGIVLEIRQILVSPDRLYEKEFVREKRVQDGWEYVLDANGNVAKDSLGNDIKVDVYKDLKATVIVSHQDKSVQVAGNIIYRNLKETRNMKVYPIKSEFLFKHRFAEFNGDEEALLKDDKQLIRRGYVDFPTNEQMIFDTSTDLKNRFARILRRQKFR